MQENPGFSFVSISKDSSLDEILSNSVFTKRSVIFPAYILIFSIAEVLAVIDIVWFVAHCLSIPAIAIRLSLS